MADISARPDLSKLEIPMDSWTQPFWEGTAAGKLLLPRCTACGTFRWPPGPFCLACHAQQLDWVPAGDGRIYSYTVVPRPKAPESDAREVYIPALIEFPDAGGVRLLAAIVGSSPASVRIGAKVKLLWSQAANATVPVFEIVAKPA